MQHPNLYFTKADAANFRERIKTDEALRARYEETTADVKKCLKEEFITEEQANGRNTVSQHADFGSLNAQANRMCSVLGLKYIVQGSTLMGE